MAVRIRLYDVEPRTDRPVLPLWAVEEQGWPLDWEPHIGDELKVSEWGLVEEISGEGSLASRREVPVRGETHYWRIVRRTHDLHPKTPILILGVRLINDSSQ